MSNTTKWVKEIRRKFLSDQVSQHPLVLHKTGVRFMASRAFVDEARFQKIKQSEHSKYSCHAPKYLLCTG